MVFDHPGVYLWPTVAYYKLMVRQMCAEYVDIQKVTRMHAVKWNEMQAGFHAI